MNVTDGVERGGSMTVDAVRLPGSAIDPAGTDVLGPTVAVLQGLNLLPTQSDLDAAGSPGAAIGGPPQSVAVIEGGATALAKWWAVTGAGAATAVWGAIIHFWDSNKDVHGSLLIAGAIASAALALAIGYILASDLRGRAAGSVATIEARARVAEAVLASIHNQPAPHEAQLPDSPRITAIKARNVRWVTQPAEDEDGWSTMALQSKPDGSQTKLLIAKRGDFAWVPVEELALPV
jgi:hypothetical protein